MRACPWAMRGPHETTADEAGAAGDEYRLHNVQISKTKKSDGATN